MYENRALYLTELTKLGAQVTLLDPHRLYVAGPTHRSGAEVVCPPALRPAVVVLLAMLAAKGTSVLRNVYAINRGYEQLADRLNQLGARIETFRDLLRQCSGRPSPPTTVSSCRVNSPVNSGIARAIASCAAGVVSDRSWCALLRHTSVTQIRVESSSGTPTR